MSSGAEPDASDAAHEDVGWQWEEESYSPSRRLTNAEQYLLQNPVSSRQQWSPRQGMAEPTHFFPSKGPVGLRSGDEREYFDDSCSTATDANEMATELASLLTSFPGLGVDSNDDELETKLTMAHAAFQMGQKLPPVVCSQPLVRKQLPRDDLVELPSAEDAGCTTGLLTHAHVPLSLTSVAGSLHHRRLDNTPARIEKATNLAQQSDDVELLWTAMALPAERFSI